MNMLDEICSEIGRGSFGAVYSVLDEMGKKWALKMFFNGGERQQKSMESDIEIGMSDCFNSPYIIRYVEKFDYGEYQCVLMDYMSHGMKHII
jgi:serine/threonine protein kinase